MRKTRSLGLCALLLLSLLLCAGTKLEVKSLGGKIIFISGVVEVLPAGSEKWQPAYKKTALVAEDKVRTGKDSYAEVVLLGDSILRLAPETELTLRGEKKDGQFVASVKLKFGRLWSNLASLTRKRSRMEVSTSAAIIGVRGTIFDTNVRKGTTVSVYKGEVEVYNPLKVDETPIEGAFVAPREVRGPGEVAPAFKEVSMEKWTVLLGQNQRLSISEDGSQERSDIDLEEDAEDEWVKWNQDRDGEMGEDRAGYIEHRQAEEAEEDE